jgi:hypothetical protein
MNSDLVSKLDERAAPRFLPAAVIELLGPLTMLGGLVWAVAQPYRLSVLHPGDAGFWDLAVQPPLLVVAVGLFFAVVVAPGILADLREAEER